MCGIVWLHLRTAQLYPRLGELLTGMLCEMGNRGSDSAGVAVYGDPIWTPPGRACVSVLGLTDAADVVKTAVGVELGAPVTVSVLDATYLISADTAPETLSSAVSAVYPDSLIAGFGNDLAVLKG